VSAYLGPLHLLLFYHPFGDNLIDCRFDERSGDRFPVAVLLPIVGDQIRIILDVGNHVTQVLD
jgi:hypothetical protein